MRKTIALILAVCTLLSFAVVASADTVTSSTTTLTTKVPAASYTMKVPANQTIDYRLTTKKIGNVTIEESTGFSELKRIEVAVGTTEFTSEKVNTTIPYSLSFRWSSGRSYGFTYAGVGVVLLFEGQQDGTVKSRATAYREKGSSRNNPEAELEYMEVGITPRSWDKALAGDYTSTITFTSKVVAVT